MRLVGFMKDGKGVVQEPDDLFAASGTVEIVKNLDDGIAVIQVILGSTEPKTKRGRKPKAEDAPEPVTD